mgnify:CR=1 FL=1
MLVLVNEKKDSQLVKKVKIRKKFRLTSFLLIRCFIICLYKENGLLAA